MTGNEIIFSVAVFVYLADDFLLHYINCLASWSVFK